MKVMKVTIATDQGEVLIQGLIWRSEGPNRRVFLIEKAGKDSDMMTIEEALDIAQRREEAANSLSS